MRWRTESELKELIHQREADIAGLSKQVSEPGSDGEDLLTATIELADLQNELEFVRGDGLDSGNPGVVIRAPRHPSPGTDPADIRPPESTSDEAS